METFETVVSTDWNSKSFNKKEIMLWNATENIAPTPDTRTFLMRVCKVNLLSFQLAHTPLNSTARRATFEHIDWIIRDSNSFLVMFLSVAVSARGVNISFPLLHIHLKKSIILVTNGRWSALAGWQHLFETLISELLNSDQKPGGQH